MQAAECCVVSALKSHQAETLFQPFKDFKDKFNVFKAEVQTVFKSIRGGFRVNFQNIIPQLVVETQMNPETGINQK